jgi:taurine dioxygenase
MGFRHIRVHPLTGALGAEVEGVSLASPLADEVFAEVHRAFLDFGVLCFRDQDLPPERHLAFARRFGAPEVHPIVEGTEAHPEVVRVFKPAGESASFGVGWHSDNSFFERPSLGTVLYGVTIPPVGGDTLFASTERAWEALSSAFQERLLGLRAVHSASRTYDPRVTGTAKYEGGAAMRYRWSDAVTAEVEHPVVRTHPETGRRGLYVNPMFTLRLVGMTEAESEAILGLLFAHVARPDFQCRVRWAPRSVVMWDNRSTWHYALDDYREYDRLMFRVTVSGDRPV